MGDETKLVNKFGETHYVTFSILLRIVGDETTKLRARPSSPWPFSILLRIVGDETMFDTLRSIFDQYAFSILLRIVGDETKERVIEHLSQFNFQYPLADRGG